MSIAEDTNSSPANNDIAESLPKYDPPVTDKGEPSGEPVGEPNNPPGDETPPDKTDQPAPKRDGGEADRPPALSRTDWAEYGLTEDQAKALEGKGELGTVLDLMDKRFLAAGREALTATETPGAKADEKAGQAAKPAEETGKAAETPPEGPLTVKLTAEDYGQELVDEMSGVVAQLNQQFNELREMKQQLQMVSTSFQSQEEAAFAERMDGYFNSLGEEYVAIVGKGKLAEMAAESKEAKARKEVNDTMFALAAGYQRLGQPIPSEKVLLERAARMVFGGHTQELARRQVAEQARNARGQFVAKPTHRDGKPLDPMSRAVKFAEDFYKKKGL